MRAHSVRVREREEDVVIDLSGVEFLSGGTVARTREVIEVPSGSTGLVIVMSGRYEQILNYVVAIDALFFGLTGAALIIFRKRARIAATNGSDGSMAETASAGLLWEHAEAMVAPPLWTALPFVAYLLTMGAIGLMITSRRLARLLLQ